MTAHTLTAAAARYPTRLRERLGDAAPAQLTTLGNLALLALPKTGLFCSARCPGHVILSAYDQAARWRDAGRCIISGFHSPVEMECLRILLRGSQPIILCPARSMPARVPPEWRKPLADGRLLILSGFAGKADRVTTQLASKRNAFVAALADEVFIAHATVGGHLEKLSSRVNAWLVPLIAKQSALQNTA
jgi:predicted Rossmann fold nucleotide-binding protein DprA/Smf involved in DNA uptake